MSMYSKSSRQNDTSSELFLQCKAAYLSIYDDINDKLESKKGLNNVLQQTGRNPTKAALERYWPKNTDELSFNDFVDICRKEPVTTSDELLNAFRKIDANGDGYISLDELYKIMNTQGEHMTKDDVKKMIDEVDKDRNGVLDYGEFTTMIMNTTAESKKISMKIMERKERKKKREGKLRSTAEDSSRKDSPKVSPRSRSDSAGRTSLVKGMPRELSHKDSGSKETPRREHSRNDKPPLPDSPRSKESSTEKTKSLKHEKVETPKTASNSARTVGEEIDYDDDVDIVSTGRPTPRIDLNAHVGHTPRNEEKETKQITKADHENKESKSDSKKENAVKESVREAKGNTSNRSVDSNALASTSKGNNLNIKEDDEAHGNIDVDKTKDPKVEYTRKGEIKNEEDRITKKTESKYEVDRETKKTESKEDINIAESTQTESSIDSVRMIKKTGVVEDLLKTSKIDNKMETPRTSRSAVDEVFKSSVRSNKMDEVAPKDTLSFLNEIFRSNRNAKSVLSRQFEMISQETDEERQAQYHDSIEINSKDRKLFHNEESTPKDPPRKEKKDGNRSTVQEETASTPHMSTKTNENSLGSQTSLRSGDKDIGVPVPSPRKNVSRLSEDDIPRPSPRVTKRNIKGKSPSTKGRDTLPDPKSLRDWMHYTSKGCFFYEEDEIVTHVYSLVLHEDSNVFLTAYPIHEPESLDLPGSEPIDTALYVFDSRGKLVTCTEQCDAKGRYGVKCDLSIGEYQVLPYTTGCRFKQRPEDKHDNMKESKLVKMKDNKAVITSGFRRALHEIFDLCDLDNNTTMSRQEFNWFNLRTSGEELGDDEWQVVVEKTNLADGEITKEGFIELNEMEAEDAQGDADDLWITLNSMGMNKGLIMDEACPYRVDVYVEESGRKKPAFLVTGIESLEKKEFVAEICQFTIEKAGESTKVRNMKDLYLYSYRNEQRATIVIDNRSRSNVSLQVDCSRSKNVVTSRPKLDYTIEIGPQDMVIAHHLLPKNELNDWTISSTETIHK